VQHGDGARDGHAEAFGFANSAVDAPERLEQPRHLLHRDRLAAVCRLQVDVSLALSARA
jgi:hypothetical protein